jgi:spermidine synthase
MGIYLTLAVPFFLAGTVVGLALTRFAGESHRIYRFDLLGAGMGALGTILFLEILPPYEGLRLHSGIGLLVAGIGLWALGPGKARIVALLAFMLVPVVPMLWPKQWIEPRPSQFKALSLVLRHPDARILAERWSPMGWLVVVDNPSAPLRYVPGMSLTCTEEPPRQLGVYLDGERLGPITRFQGRLEELSFLDCQTASLPYHLLEQPEVLVLGSGGGMEVLRALYYGARRIDAVEEDPQMVKLVQGAFVDFSGRIYAMDNVKVYTGGMRVFLSRSLRRYDLIQISLEASYRSAGAFQASYHLTLEALQDALSHLRNRGILAITQWAQLPPRQSLRLLLTAVTALERQGIDRPAEHVALIRSWRTTTLLVRREPFRSHEVQKIRDFCTHRAFDLVHLSGMRAEEANRHNRLRNPSYFLGAQALLGEDREEFLQRYKFQIRPVTDQRPFFLHFFRWRTLPEILSLKGRGGMSLLEWTYPLLGAALIVAMASGAVLILLPLAFIRRRERADNVVRSGALVVFFLSLGVGFLFLEMAFFQRFILYLGHPVLSASVVISTFLIFAGAGSGWSRRWRALFEKRARSRSPMDIPAAALGILIWAILLLVGLPHFFRWTLGFPLFLRMGMGVLLIAPLGFFMGMPFPLGLERLAPVSVKHIPWAWGINGCASVVATILASLLALQVGFQGVILSAMAMYGMAAGASLFLTKNPPG